MRETTRRERRLAAPVFSSQLVSKLEQGTYPREEVACFCGSNEYTVLTELDRYGLPHRMVCCKECALIRATPRMTKEAYHAFYNEEYRYIFSDRAKGDVDEEHAAQAEHGKKLIQKLEDFDIPMPKTVVDFGCYLGGMLQPFKDAGAKTYGIELDAEAAASASANGHVVVGQVGTLATLGVKADLIIVSDVIEHLLDLREMEKLKEILAPEGQLYVYTPGFFRTSLQSLWQIAHTYQFCQRSLEYVMTEMGFTESYSDEECDSFWTLNKFEYFKVDKPKEFVEYITDHVFKSPYETRKMPRFRGVCKFSRKLLFSNVEENLSIHYPDISELMNKHSGEVICIGGGPSVNGQVEALRELHNTKMPILCIARMYPFLLQHGIVPEYVLSLDCSEAQEVCFQKPHPRTTHLLALVSRPSIYKMLQNHKCYVFSSQDNVRTKELRIKHGYKEDTVINTGGSVAIGTIPMALYLGFTDLHVFGLDLMFTNSEQTHAEGIAGPSVPQNFVMATIKGENVLTTPSFIDFANQTLDIISVGHSMGCLKSVRFYGDSLIKKLWDCQWHEEVA